MAQFVSPFSGTLSPISQISTGETFSGINNPAGRIAVSGNPVPTLQQQFGSSLTPPGGGILSPQRSASGGFSSVNVSNTNRDLTGSTQTRTPIAPTGDLPTLAQTPAIDEARIRRLTQTRSAAGSRRLRTALRESIAASSRRENPNVAALINRQALEGFGQGIADVFTKAQAQATGEERFERGLKIQRDQAIFNSAMQNYMARFGSTTTTANQFSDPANSGTIVPVNRGNIQGSGQTSEVVGGPRIGSPEWAAQQFAINTGGLA